MLNKFLAVTLSASMLTSLAVAPVVAQPYGRNPGPPPNAAVGRNYDDGYRDGYRRGYDDGSARRRFDDTPEYRGADYGPGRSFAAIGRERQWRDRYQHDYTYNDDAYYKQCRNGPDPGGVIAGALIGGLLGNAVGRGGGREGLTIAGVILGGAAGAALTSGMDCADQSYAYQTYYDGFNAGRPDADYHWRNPRNNHRGTFHVGRYYNDPDGFRCATYSQTIYVHNRPQTATGRACRQPDGTWAIVS